MRKALAELPHIHAIMLFSNAKLESYGVHTLTVKFSTVPVKNWTSILAFKFLRRLRLYVHSHDVTAAILVSQNNETEAMLVSQTSPLGVELFSYANAFFCYNKFAYMLVT